MDAFKRHMDDVNFPGVSGLEKTGTGKSRKTYK